MELIAKKQYIWFIISFVILVLVFCAAVFSVGFLYKTIRDLSYTKQSIATYEQNKIEFKKEVDRIKDLSERIYLLEQKYE